MSKADQKARLAKSHASARGLTPMLVGEPSDVPGFQAWTVGKVMVLMPKLLPNTPASIRRRQRDRIIADATGECPRCHNIVGDPQAGKVHDYSNMAHEHDCPISDASQDDFEPWIDPASRKMREAITWNRGDPS